MTAVGYPAILISRLRKWARSMKGMPRARTSAENKQVPPAAEKDRKGRLPATVPSGGVSALGRDTTRYRHRRRVGLCSAVPGGIQRFINGTQSTCRWIWCSASVYGATSTVQLFQATGCEDFLHRHGALLLPLQEKADEKEQDVQA